MRSTHLHFQWLPDMSCRGFQTGVSLHSHTVHSKESLDFIYKVARQVWPLQLALRKGEERFKEHHGVALDLRRGWWTPPLAPLDAHKVEAAQIQALGLAPIVSLTDHDEIEAPMSLQAVDPSRDVPISVEWTVPFGLTFFHLGIHNLPARFARGVMETLRDFTARPNPAALRDILAGLDRTHGVLLVFNHPLWDEKGVGAQVHQKAVLEFLRQSGQHIHAIEINGLRPWKENRAAILLAREWQKPAISGGDRHAVEANTVLNLSQASSFAAFADEIRAGYSEVLITKQYRQAHASRILNNLVDVMQTYQNHGYGWREWPDRVFFHCPDNVVRSLRELWGDNHPLPVRIFDSIMCVAGKAPVRSAVRAVSIRAENPVRL